MAIFDSLFLEYYTPNLEPPFSYAVTIDISNQKDGLKFIYKLDYLDREDLKEEEIIEEGADPEDSFTWEGTLNQAWRQDIEAILNKTKLSAEEEEKNCFIRIDSTKEGFALNIEEWDYFMQEFYQAVLEQMEKESPLTIRYDERKGKIPVTEISLFISFSERKGALIKKTDKGEDSKNLTWKQVYDIMTLIYSFEYNFEETVESPFDGEFLDLIGEDQWLRLPDAVLNSEKNKDKIHAMIQKLKSL